MSASAVASKPVRSGAHRGSGGPTAEIVVRYACDTPVHRHGGMQRVGMLICRHGTYAYCPAPQPGSAPHHWLDTGGVSLAALIRESATGRTVRRTPR